MIIPGRVARALTWFYAEPKTFAQKMFHYPLTTTATHIMMPGVALYGMCKGVSGLAREDKLKGPEGPFFAFQKARMPEALDNDCAKN